MFYKRSCSQKFCNIHRKTPVLESVFNKVAGVQVYLEKHLRTAACDYSSALVFYLFSAVSLQLYRKTMTFKMKKMFIEIRLCNPRT